MKRLDRKTTSPQDRLNFCADGLAAILHLPKMEISLNYEMRRKAKYLAIEAAHACFEIFPELREEGSLFRYFVVMEARKHGLRGTAVTEFVEKAFADGTWWKYCPQELITSQMGR